MRNPVAVGVNPLTEAKAGDPKEFAVATGMGPAVSEEKWFMKSPTKYVLLLLGGYVIYRMFLK